jgi:UDP-N-acetylglucosamine 2-epimerase (non-hydrolysing)
MNILFVFGTRPEAIKLAPLILMLKSGYSKIKTTVCITAQHRQLLDEVLKFFAIEVDFDLNIMQPNQSLSSLTSRLINALDTVIMQEKPDLIIVQGDTTTAMVGALSGFYHKVKVAHIEAGLRSYDKTQPYPEEINRRIISQISDFHFAPTLMAKDALEAGNITGYIEHTGNTVIDALFLGIKNVNRNQKIYHEKFPFLSDDKRFILTTVHRRENFGPPLENICNAIRTIKENYADIDFVIPIHPNPNVKEIIDRNLHNTAGVYLIDPLPYDSLIWMIQHSYFVLTDSGGIQEEAPSLGKPVIVMRNVTERMEGVLAGNAILSGTNITDLIRCMEKLIMSDSEYKKMTKIVNPYGDGQSSEKIIKSLLRELNYEI